LNADRAPQLKVRVGCLLIMKQCPNCNRTYPDDTQSFCLDDGTPLIASYDPEATHVIDPLPRTAPAGAAQPRQASLTRAHALRTNPALYIVIALLALLVGGGLVALLKSDTKEAQFSAPTPNPATTPNVSSSSPIRLASTPEKREWTVTVLGTDRWRDTGITISSGDRIAFEASGLVNTEGGTPNTNPNGYAPAACDKPDCFAQGIGYGTLVGKIGTGDSFRIGASLDLAATYHGKLYLAVNDNSSYLSDNNGSFTVRVTKR
jgi:hypothetical protein